MEPDRSPRLSSPSETSSPTPEPGAAAPKPRRTARRWALVVASALLLGLLAACGSGGDDAGVARWGSAVWNAATWQ